jgi:hypothetical protein
VRTGNSNERKDYGFAYWFKEATFTPNEYYLDADNLKNPLLGSDDAVHNKGTWDAWWNLEFKDGFNWEVDYIVLQKARFDCCGNRVISKFKIEYMDPSGNWQWYNDGNYVETN